MTATTTPTQALVTQGFKVRVAADSAGSAGTYAEIGQIDQSDFSLPEETEEVHEFTTNSSPRGIKERQLANRGEVGPTSFSLLANPALPIQTTLNGYKDNRTKIWLEITSPDASLVLVQTGWISKRVFTMQEEPLMLQVEFTSAGAMQAGSTYLNS